MTNCRARFCYRGREKDREGRDGQEPEPHQPFILPLLRRSFPEEGLSFPCEVLWFGSKAWRGGTQ